MKSNNLWLTSEEYDRMVCEERRSLADRVLGRQHTDEEIDRMIRAGLHYQQRRHRLEVIFTIAWILGLTAVIFALLLGWGFLFDTNRTM